MTHSKWQGGGKSKHSYWIACETIGLPTLDQTKVKRSISGYKPISPMGIFVSF